MKKLRLFEIFVFLINFKFIFLKEPPPQSLVLNFVQNLLKMLIKNTYFGNLDFIKSIDEKNIQNIDFGKLIETFNDFFKSYNVKYVNKLII